MVKVLLVAPRNTLPSLSHTKLNGLLPEGVVLNVALVPEQFVIPVSGVVLTLANTVRVALLVTLPQAPLTVTLYVPALAALTDPMLKLLLVWPLKTLPSLRHT